MTGKQLNIITQLHKRTSRDYVKRMIEEKIHCMQVAKEYGFDYWDGDRKYGYGGYTYDGRWSVVAEQLIRQYNLGPQAKILDVGCGKGFLLHEFQKLLPQATIKGFDISEYGLANTKEEVKPHCFKHRAQDPFPFKDGEFDLVYSITTLHNLAIFDLKKALQEMERVGKNKYVVTEGYRNDAELFNLECWALTCESFFRPEEWVWLFQEFAYSGDYEFIFFE
jgi:ubiquinone/menaquinone biosynthesis C-methylase UbiE